ncbi:MAG: IPT/TIG domain-containing protein [Planctomycetota bacterium]|nr:IPT/TIG domain-containing protein [Planctomycetota bacterium]
MCLRTPRNIEAGPRIKSFRTAMVLAALILGLAFSGACGSNDGRSAGAPARACGIDSICPAEGSLSGGELLTITGFGFEDTPEVFFGVLELTQVTFISNTEITVVTPSGPPDSVDVVVVNPSGGTDSAPGAYTYRSLDPAQDSIEPNEELQTCSWTCLLSFSIDLTIHNAIDEDYVCFTSEEPNYSTVTLTPDSATGNLDLEIFDVSTGMRVTGSYELIGSEALSTPGAGQFAARVFGVCGGVGDYTLTISN